MDWSSKRDVMAKVAQNGYALYSASDELRADKAVVTAAIAQEGHALQHASDELQLSENKEKKQK
jgi:hypothetical protein